MASSINPRKHPLRSETEVSVGENKSLTEKKKGLCGKIAGIFHKKKSSSSQRKKVAATRRTRVEGRAGRLNSLEGKELEGIASRMSSFSESVEELRKTTEEASGNLTGMTFFKSYRCPRDEVFNDGEGFFKKPEVFEEREVRNFSTLEEDRSSGVFEDVNLESKLQSLERFGKQFKKTSKKGNAASCCGCFTKFCQMAEECLSAIKRLFIRIFIFFQGLFLKLKEAILGKNDLDRVEEDQRGEPEEVRGGEEVEKDPEVREAEAFRQAYHSYKFLVSEIVSRGTNLEKRAPQEQSEKASGILLALKRLFKAEDGIRSLEERVESMKQQVLMDGDGTKLSDTLKNTLSEITEEIYTEMDDLELMIADIMFLEEQVKRQHAP